MRYMTRSAIACAVVDEAAAGAAEKPTRLAMRIATGRTRPSRRWAGGRAEAEE
jgi:hypothetical protein